MDHPSSSLESDIKRPRFFVGAREVSVMAVDTNPNLHLERDTNQPQKIVGAGDSNVQRL